MAIFKPFRILESQLNDLPIVDGQLIITTDTNRIYIDIENSRHEYGKTVGTATIEYVDSSIKTAMAAVNKKEVVTSLDAMTDLSTIYLIANDSTEQNNIYDEYIVIQEGEELIKEKIGTTEVDLTNYVQETDLTPITNAEIDAMFEDEVTA